MDKTRFLYGLALLAALLLLDGRGRAGEPAPAKLEEELVTVRAEIAALKQQLAEAKARCEKLRETLAAREKDLAETVGELESAVKALASVYDTFERLKERDEERRLIARPPLKRAKVKSVDKAGGCLVLNVGERHEVKKGWAFIVFRGDEYVGQVIVDEVRADESTAHFVRKNMKLDPQAGDEATTRLQIDP